MEMPLVDTIKSTLGKYTYILNGRIGELRRVSGKFVSSTGAFYDRRIAAKALSDAASRSIFINTNRGAAAFKFSVRPLQTVFSQDRTDINAHNDVAETVIRGSWLKLVGRASPSAGKFVAHLVAACPKCANYNSIEKIVDHLQGHCIQTVRDLSAHRFANAKIKEICDPARAITEEKRKKATRLANKYIDELKVKRTLPDGSSSQPLIVDASGRTNNFVLGDEYTCADIMVLTLSYS